MSIFAEKTIDMGDERIEEYRLDLLSRAHNCWEAMAGFREERNRCKRFTYGDQWSDLMPSSCGMMREEEYILSQGNIPLKNNLIRRLVRNVLGVFRNQWSIPRCVARDPSERGQAAAMERLLEYNLELNRMDELYARTMEEFLISGMAIHRKWFGRKGNRLDCWTDFVSPDRFFMDNCSRDFRNWDINIIGEIHEMDFDDICATFAHSGDDCRWLGEIYSMGRHEIFPGEKNGETGRGKCKVIEIWSKEYTPRYLCHDKKTGICYKTDRPELEMASGDENGYDAENLTETQWIMDEEWHYHFLTPDGRVIAKGITPYLHGKHPYTLKAYPLIDGEIHSFVADIIDQQKFTNRLISMYDWILRASAKGVLLLPEGSLPEGVNINDVADEWSRFNGVILYRARSGVPLPQQIHSNINSGGITDLLTIQMQMMEDISGVNGALQGKLDSNSMSGTLYNQQTRNSLTALADLLKSYNDFVLEATAADASNIRQYYSPDMISAILGISDPMENTEHFFDPTFDFSIRERVTETEEESGRQA